MYIKRIICIISAFLFAFSSNVTLYANDGSWVSAERAVLYCPDNGEFIYQKNADDFCEIASLTKIMTAVIVLENNALDDIVCVDKSAQGTEGSSAYLCSNELLTVKDLLYALLLESANDAAVALAVHTSGSVDEFVSLMNDKAAKLGLTKTHFENPHGLNADGHGSSAYDLAILTAYAMKNEEFVNITKTKSIHIDTIDGKNSHYLLNHNRMLTIYDGAIGVKTGYTKSSGRCLVTAAERNGVTLIAVTLNAPTDWDDHRIMLDYGFTKIKSVALPAETEEYIIDVISGDKATIKAEAQSESFVFDCDIIPDAKEIYLRSFYYAPIENGEIIGSVAYTYNGEIIASVPIKAKESVKEIKYKKGYFEQIADFFR